MKSNELEFQFISESGTTTHYGNIGEPTGIIDSRKQPVCIGDIVARDVNGQQSFDYVVRRDHDLPTYLNSKESVVGDKSLLVQQSWRMLVVGFLRQNLIVQARSYLATVPTREGHPFTMLGLAAMLDAAHTGGKFKPATPTTDLLYSLFGGSDFKPCPYMPDDLDAKAFSTRVKVWSPSKGHYFYMYRDSMAYTPLAYLRIDEDMDHGPSSYLDRVTHAYYFDEASNFRFSLFLDTIHTKPKVISRADQINRVAVELAITVIADAVEGK